MPAVSTQPSAQHQALYRATIEEAAAGGGLLMGKLVAAAAMVLHTREKASIDLRERDALAASAKRLGNEESALRTQYSNSLMAAFTQTERGKKVPLLVAATMDFDQLELMDEWQVEERVAIARAHQSALLASDVSLAELNTLICSILGLKSVHPERNPLRPEAYVDALKEAIEETQAPAAMRLEWLAIMGLALGQELRDLYLNFSRRLRDEGVIAVGYAVSQMPSSADSAGARGLMDAEPIVQPPVMASPQGHSFGTQAQRAIPTQSLVRRGPEIGSAGDQGRMVQPDFGGDETLLTLDKLRRLLAGELDHQGGGKVAAFADQFAREFDGDSVPLDTPPSGFDATVPAALEALTEMRQVDHVVQRLVQRQNITPVPLSPGGSTGGGFIEADRAHLRGRAQGVAQALSLEVVKLMVENMARDRRLLAPIQQLIRQMEPALARLSLVDPRLFTDKQHPARVLVQEISHHSMAYVSVHTTGFSEFLAGVERAVASLMQAPIENMEPFAMALNGLQLDWNQSAMVAARNRQVAVKALETAEQRNVLAEKIARQIDSHPDASKVPVAVIDFLCGPWAQVVAQARIAGGAGSGAADKYQALISALLWSTHPALTHKNSAKLTRLIPMLLGTLRDGLETIHYPSLKASAFFEALMGFHQEAFRANQKPLDVPASHPVDANVRTRLLEDGNPWLAPEEALASNFIDLPDQLASVVSTPPNEALAGGDIVPVLTELPLGTWVELKINEKWVRTQLTWASPHGTLFLFTSVFGTTQSMTRRSGEKLVAAGNLRVISGAPMVDGALDAVAQQAMRNSVGLGAA